jgi:hypothetical protein
MHDRTPLRRRLLLLAITVLAVLVVPAPPARAQPAAQVTDAELDRPLIEPPRDPSDASKKRAKELFNEGLDFAQRGKTREALRAFRKAYEQDATSDSMANLAALEMQLGKTRAAAEHLTRAMIRITITDKAFDDLLERLEAAKKLIGTVDLAVKVAGADVQWDAEWLGAGPMSRPIFVDPDTDHVLLARHGGVEVRRTVRLKKGEKLSLVLDADDFPGAAGDAAAPSGSPAKDEPSSSTAKASVSLPIVLGGTGIAVAFAGVAAGGFGAMVAADGERTKIERGIRAFGGTCKPQPLPGFVDDCHARDQEASNQAIGLGIGIGGTALALAAAGVTLGLAFRTPQASVAVLPGLGGVWIAGKF